MLTSANFSLGVVKKRYRMTQSCVNNIPTKFQLYILFRFGENEGGEGGGGESTPSRPEKPQKAHF